MSRAISLAVFICNYLRDVLVYILKQSAEKVQHFQWKGLKSSWIYHTLPKMQA